MLNEKTYGRVLPYFYWGGIILGSLPFLTILFGKTADDFGVFGPVLFSVAVFGWIMVVASLWLGVYFKLKGREPPEPSSVVAPIKPAPPSLSARAEPPQEGDENAQ